MARRENREEGVLEDASLCDLPVLNTSPSKEEEGEKTNKKLIKKKNNQPSILNDVVSETQEEFAFGSANGSSSLCAAEDVFFRGRILPLRPSLTSDVWTPLGPEPNRIPVRARSRSESVDRAISRAGFRSISSRSAHNEEAPIAVARVASEPRHRARNRFDAHPSPKPHVLASRPRSSGIERVSSVKAKHKSSMWGFFRVGLVRAPELELQELKAVISLRSNSQVHKGSTNSNPMSRSSSGSNSDNSANKHHSNKTSSIRRSRESGLRAVENNKQNRMKFLSGCACTAESVASDIAVVVKTKGTGGCTNNINAGDDFNIVTTKLEEALLLENPRPIKEKSENSGRSDDDYYYYYRDDQKLIEKQSSKEQGRRRRKQAVSHHRTYEWLKELSHANLPMHV